MMTTPELSCDVLIIGSGAAGLSLALRLAEKHKVIVLSKGPVSEGSTFYAQGGIAAVFDETDSIASHVEDTLIAGAGICDRHAVEFVASNARTCVQWLIDQGVLIRMSSQTARRAIISRVKAAIVIAVSFMPPTLPERKSKPRWSVGRKIILIFRCWNAATPLI